MWGGGSRRGVCMSVCESVMDVYLRVWKVWCWGLGCWGVGGGAGLCVLCVNGCMGVCVSQCNICRLMSTKGNQEGYIKREKARRTGDRTQKRKI